MILKIDVSDLEKYEKKIREIYMQSLGYSQESADFLLTRIRNSAKNNLHPVILGSFDNNELVGFIFGFDFCLQNWWAQQINGQLPQNHDWYNNTFELNELLVLPSYQKQGRGKKLLKKLLDQIYHDQVLLGTAKENNEHVIRFYTSFGFEIVIDSFQYKDASYGTTLIMGWKRNK